MSQTPDLPDLPDTAQTWPLVEPLCLERVGLYECVRQFVLCFALPKLPESAVIQAWQNKAALPATADDLAVISLIETCQRGSSLELYDPEQERLEVRALYETRVQIDFWAKHDAARQRALCLALAASSAAGAEFMRCQGFGLHYCQNLGEHSRDLDSGQYLRRWRLELGLGHNQGLCLSLPGADQAEINQLYPLTRQNSH